MKHVRKVGQRVLRDYYLIQRQKLVELISHTTQIQKTFLQSIQKRDQQEEQNKTARQPPETEQEHSAKDDQSNNTHRSSLENDKERCQQYILEFSLLVQYFRECLWSSEELDQHERSATTTKKGEARKTETTNILHLAMQELSTWINRFLQLFPRYLKMKMILFHHRSTNNFEQVESITASEPLSAWMLMGSVASAELGRELKQFLIHFSEQFNILVLDEFFRALNSQEEAIHFKDLLSLRNQFIRCYFVTLLCVVWSTC